MRSHAEDGGSSPTSPEAPPRALVAVAPHTRLRSFDGQTPGRGKKVYVVRELREALLDSYTTDAHLVAYVVEGWPRQFRILKRAWQQVGAPVSVNVFLADIDTPDHGPWGEAFVTGIVTAFETHPTLARAGLYFTKHGCRIVQPIDRPLSVGEVEPYIEAWLDELETAGVHDEKVHRLDRNCRDWTRHFRLPNVRRDGVDYRSPIVRLERMAPISPPAPKPAPTKPIARRDRKPLGPVVPVNQVPDDWKARALVLAEAIAREPSDWHQLFLYLGGALIEAGLAPERLPVVVAAISLATKLDTRTDDRIKAARSTLQLAQRGEPYAGHGALEARFPAVALALDRALQLESPGARPIAETELALRDAIGTAPDGVTLVSAECGLGKTRALLEVAAERAQRTHASEKATGARAPLHSKTVISVDKHELALQVVDDLALLGVPARRVFGPLSLVDDVGERVCRKHHVALPLVEGGQSMRYELCEGRGLDPCEYLSSCRATHGSEGPEDARVIVGVHALLPQLVREAGTTGLLGIDEPPPLVEAIRITPDELAIAEAELGSFDGIFSAALKPALAALAAWLQLAPAAAPLTLREALQAQRWATRAQDFAWAQAATDEAGDDLADFARAAISDDHHRTGPPLKWAAVQIAMSSPTLARRIGTASRVLHTLHHALTTKGEVKLHAELDAAKQPVAIITRIRESLARALTREGSTVVLDANAALNAPLYAKAIDYEPPLHRFAAVDGAPITRTLLRSSKATRSGWLDEHGELDPLCGSFRKALDAAVDWALEDESASTLAIITMKSIRDLLEASLRDPNVVPDDGLSAARRCLLSDARALLAPTLRRWRGAILWGHYGAVRGLNAMMDADALVTLGDPRPNVSQVENDLVLLGVEDPDGRRVDDLARAELEQAHGRLRACRRTRPARALHVGTLVPGGSGWRGDFDIIQLADGRPRKTTEPPPEELRSLADHLGGVAAAARLLRLHHVTFGRYLRGERQVPEDLLARVRTLTGSEPETLKLRIS